MYVTCPHLHLFPFALVALQILAATSGAVRVLAGILGTAPSGSALVEHAAAAVWSMAEGGDAEARARVTVVRGILPALMGLARSSSSPEVRANASGAWKCLTGEEIT